MTEITRSRVGVSTYLVPTGPLLDAPAVDALRARLEECIEQREIQLVLDLVDVPLIASPALEVLLDIQERVARQGGGLRVVNVNSVLRDAFYLTGLDQRIALEAQEKDEIRRTPAPAGAAHRRIGELLIQLGEVCIQPETLPQRFDIALRRDHIGMIRAVAALDHGQLGLQGLQLVDRR